MYQKEINRLKTYCHPGLWDLLKEEKAFIAGGALTSIFTNKPVNDIDVYVRSPQSLLRIVAEAWHCDRDFLSTFDVRITNKSDKSITCSSDERVIQLIYFNFFDSAQAIFDTFDFTLNMAAYDCAEESLVLHDDFLKHNAQRFIAVNPKTAYPLISVMRVNKYTERGYNTSKKELMKLLSCVASLEISSWQDANEQMGSMYGKLDLTPEDGSDFSKEKLWEVLDNIAEVDIDYGSVQVLTIEAIWGSLVETFCGEERDIYQFNYFKWVDENYNSNHCYGNHKKITYTPHSVVNGGDHGLYFSHRGVASGYGGDGKKAVALVPLQDCKIVSDRMIGNVLVDRDVTHMCSSTYMDLEDALKNISEKYKHYEEYKSPFEEE